MLAIKITLTITILSALLAAFMIIPDREGEWSRRYEWWATLGGLAVITTILGIAVTLILVVWQVIP